MSKKHCLIYLFAMCAPLEAMKQKMLHQNLLQEYIQAKQQHENKDVVTTVDERPRLVKKHAFELRNSLAENFETTSNEPVLEVCSGGLSRLNPVNWASSAYGFFFGKQTQLDVKKIDWQNPFRIKQDEENYVVAGDKRYVIVIDEENTVDVTDLGSREKVVCYEAQSPICSTDWSSDRTCFAVREEAGITIFDLKRGPKISKQISTTKKDRSYFWQKDEHDIRYIVITDKKVIIYELLTEETITLEHDKKCAIVYRAPKDHVIGIVYDDKTMVMYDMRHDYKPSLKIQAKEFMSAFIPHLHMFSKNRMALICDSQLKIFDTDVLKEIYSKPQANDVLPFGYWDETTTKCLIDGIYEDCVHDVIAEKVTPIKVEERSSMFGGSSASLNYACYYYIKSKQHKDEYHLYDVLKEHGKPVKVCVTDDLLPRGRFSMNSWFVTPITKNKVELYDCVSNKCIDRPHDGRHFSGFGRYPRYFVWSVNAKTLTIFDIITQKEDKLSFNYEIDMREVMFDKKHGHLIVPKSDKKFYVHDVANNMRVNIVDLKSNVKFMQFSGDGAWCTVVPHERPNTLMVYDIKKNYACVTETPLVFDEAVKYLIFTPGEICTVVTENLMYIYSLKSEKIELLTVTKK